jgi:thiosulfate/3-mercaptopyruvate sulfurtransferase
MAASPFPLVSTEWVTAELRAPDIRLVDASWRMPGSPPARMEFLKRHIPGAVFFDLDEVADASSALPHMLPTPEKFSDAVGALGIANNHRVVIYDDTGVFSAARVWWTFRALGHDQVSVLDGGLPKWLKEGRAVESGPAEPSLARYAAASDRRLSRTHDDVRAALSEQSSLVFDARPAPRFNAEAPEPRAGLRRGHMPGARNIPHASVLAADGTMKPPEQLRALFAAEGYAADRPVITTCGSGVTAAVLALALEVIGASKVGLYDGSWAEWGREANDPAHFPVVGGQT